MSVSKWASESSISEALNWLSICMPHWMINEADISSITKLSSSSCRPVMLVIIGKIMMTPSNSQAEYCLYIYFNIIIILFWPCSTEGQVSHFFFSIYWIKVSTCIDPLLWLIEVIDQWPNRNFFSLNPKLDSTVHTLDGRRHNIGPHRLSRIFLCCQSLLFTLYSSRSNQHYITRPIILCSMGVNSPQDCCA